MSYMGDVRVVADPDQRRGVVVIRKEAVVAILGSPIAYYAAFAKVLGGVEAGIFASQFFYWYGKGHDPEGWVYKTQVDIEDETGLSRRNQETARKKLRKLGVLEERYAGMPAKLYYRLNLDVLFPLMNEWFAEEVVGDDGDGMPDIGIVGAPTGEKSQDGGMRQPRMRDSDNQGSTDAPTKDARSSQSSMAESDNHDSANAPHMDGGSRRANTKTTTETTSENTTETTTQTTTDGAGPESDGSGEAERGVDVAVDVGSIPDWILREFQFYLGNERSINSADAASLAELAKYPQHIVLQSFDAAQTWLADPSKKPIYRLARWLVGTARRKVADEQERGNGVSEAPNEFDFDWLSEVVIGPGDPDDPDDGEYESAPAPEPEPEPELEKPMSEEQVFWASVLTELETRVPSETYERWIRGMTLRSCEDDVYVIGLADARSVDWVQNRFTNTLRQTLSSRMGHRVQVRFEI